MSTDHYNLSEIKEIIHEEIPESHNTDGYEFGQIEIPFQLIIQQIDNRVIDTQSNDGNKNEGKILRSYFRTSTLECPNSIQEIIRCGRQNKSY